MSLKVSDHTAKRRPESSLLSVLCSCVQYLLGLIDTLAEPEPATSYGLSERQSQLHVRSDDLKQVLTDAKEGLVSQTPVATKSSLACSAVC